MNDNGFQDLKDVETVQDLTFNVKVELLIPLMVSVLIHSRDAQARLNTSNVHQYDSNKLEACDIVATSPWANNELNLFKLKKVTNLL